MLAMWAAAAACPTRASEGVHLVTLRGAPPSVAGVTRRFSFGFAGNFDADTLAALRASPDVADVVENCLVRAEPVGAMTQETESWGLDRIDSRAGLDGRYEDANHTGEGVAVHVLDTAVRAHSSFADRLLPGWSAGCDEEGCQAGYEPGGLALSGSDCSGHGTFCASLVAGRGYGVAQRAGVVPVQVLDCSGFGSTAGVIAGVEWAVASGASVISMSLGGGRSDALDSAVLNAHMAGVVVVAAAGNDASNACLFSPAASRGAIAVGATTNSDSVASYSNAGPCVRIFAPGSDILGAYGESSSAVASGTSMAAPFVAGAAAQLRAAQPSWNSALVRSSLLCISTRGALDSVPALTANSFLFAGPGIDAAPGCALPGSRPFAPPPSPSPPPSPRLPRPPAMPPPSPRPPRPPHSPPRPLLPMAHWEQINIVCNVSSPSLCMEECDMLDVCVGFERTSTCCVLYGAEDAYFSPGSGVWIKN